LIVARRVDAENLGPFDAQLLAREVVGQDVEAATAGDLQHIRETIGHPDGASVQRGVRLDIL
jgi:hypothetical protein